jgi:CheY-like chemotaxis protein/predicted Ser/Thr protein kinase
MANLDGATAAEHAVSLRLLTQDQVVEAWDETDPAAPAAHFLRIMERKGYLTPWQSQKLVKQETDGYFLGGARILYKIASGSYGRVYRAEDLRTGRMLALKVLRRKWSENKHVLDLFEREGRMGMSLRHPNIVEILSVNIDQASHQHYITMEFVEGGNLRDFLRGRKKLEPEEMLRILEECTAGLTFAFSHGVTHRDMKASNILISSTKTAKLVDFGLAGTRKMGYDPLEQEVSVERTVDYAGLEMATGVSEGDTRSDIFFLGCVTYQMLTGRFPLEVPKSTRAKMSRDRFLGVKPIRPDEVKYPSVVRLVENMMSLDPQTRFQTPSQLLEAVRGVRRDLLAADKPQGKAGLSSTIFIAERDEGLQDLFREKFKEKGLRVLLAADPARALDRFRQQPFDVLVDAGTTGEPGLFVFERILHDAQQNNLDCSGVLILAEDQAHWEEKISQRPNQVIMVQPVKFKQLYATILELIGLM